jgi:hypothetical protein
MTMMTSERFADAKHRRDKLLTAIIKMFDKLNGALERRIGFDFLQEVRLWAGWLGLLSNDYFAVLDDFRDADFYQARIGKLKLIHLSKTAFSCAFRFDDGSDALAATWTGVDQPKLT